MGVESPAHAIILHDLPKLIVTVVVTVLVWMGAAGVLVVVLVAFTVYNPCQICALASQLLQCTKLSSVKVGCCFDMVRTEDRYCFVQDWCKLSTREALVGLVNR